MERHTGISWVRPDREVLPDIPHRPANAQFYDTDMSVVSECGVDLKPGSSKHGKAFLAFVGWNCIATRYLAKERGAKGVI